MRVGGVKTIKVDVRIVCATNRDLEKALKEKALRDDLYYRLNEISIILPPLRGKKEDIPLLIEHFLKKYNSLYNKNFHKLSSNALRILERYDWPGNVRQLENQIKQIVVRENENIIYETLKAQPSITSPDGGQTSTPSPEETYSLKKRVSETVANEEKRLIAQVLNKTNWNRRKAAEILKISYRSLLYKIKEYNDGITELNKRLKTYQPEGDTVVALRKQLFESRAEVVAKEKDLRDNEKNFRVKYNQLHDGILKVIPPPSIWLAWRAGGPKIMVQKMLHTLGVKPEDYFS